MKLDEILNGREEVDKIVARVPRRTFKRKKTPIKPVTVAEKKEEAESTSSVLLPNDS